MNNYEFSDFGIFEDSIGTTESLQVHVDSIKSKISNLKSVLSSESIFMGPIAENCREALDEADINMETISDNLSKICDYLVSVSSNYNSGDNSAKSTILELNYSNFKGRAATVAAAAASNIASSTSSSSKSSGIVPVSTSAYNNVGGLSGSHLDFINSIKDGAVASYNEYGVLPSVTMAQAILESGWGNSSIGNNIFGIKAGSNWSGKTQSVVTNEQDANGNTYQVNATFRDYDSVADSIKDHGKLFTQDFYKPVIDATNYADACRAVKNCGYASAVNYANDLINIIETYGLDQWDPK